MYRKEVLMYLLSVCLLLSVKFVQGQNWIVYNRSNSVLPHDYVLSLSKDNRGAIWIGEEGSYLVRINGEEWSVWNMGLAEIISLAVDGQNNLWIGSDGGPLTKYDGIDFTEFLPDRIARHIALDREDNVWVGSYAGLSKFDGNNWEHYDSSNSDLPYNHVYTIATDSLGTVWAGSADQSEGYSALVEFDGVNWMVHSQYSPVSGPQSISIDRENKLWIGSCYKLIHYDRTSWNEYTFPDSNFWYLGAIAIDKDNNVWCGFDGGLAKFDGTIWDIYTTENSQLPAKWITSIVIDVYGNKWLGTYGGGLAVFNENGIVTNAIDTENNIYPEQYVLYQNYPNPFNPTTSIKCSLPKNTNVTLTVYNTAGQVVKVLVNKNQSSGNYTVKWDARYIPSGVYFYQLQADDFQQVKKCILMK
jgi:ligand-binding sensor domain-containing protein